MKRYFNILFCAICAIALFSCSKENEAPSMPEDGIVPPGYTMETLTAVSEQTKTTIDNNGVTLWAANDEIKVICSDNSVSDFTIQDGVGTNTGDFRGLVPEGKTAVYAVYPAANYSSVSGSTVKVSIPSSQTGVFGAGNLAVAKVDADDHSMAFKNVNAFISFTIPSGIAKVVISSVSGANLAGTLSVSCSGDAPSAGALENGASSVTTTFPDANGGTYYISVAPGITHTKGLLLTYYKMVDNVETESGTYYLNKTITTVANANITMGTVEAEGNYYVTVSGAGDKSGMNWENAFSAEQMWKKLHLAGTDAATDAAKLAAIDGATFYLGAGTYDFGETPEINFNETDAVTLTFKGGYNASTGVRNLESNPTIITGDDSHQCLILRNKMNITLDGLQFTHGSVSGNPDGALLCSGDNLHVTMTDCVVSDNASTGKNGAGLVLDSIGDLDATRVTFSGNTGIVSPALLCLSSDMTATDCVFQNNSASGTNAWCGAVRVRKDSPTAVFTGCTFDSNSSTGDSGCFVQSEGTVTIDDCTFTNNTCTGNGGALTVTTTNTADPTVTTIIKGGTSFTENEAYLGGAIYTAVPSSGSFTSVMDISEDCVFSENHATGWAGGIHFKSKGSLTVTDCTFSGNYGDGDSGAFNADNAAGTFTFTRVTFSGNHADGDAGGAMWISDGTYNFTDCTFTENYSAAGGGGAVYQNKTGNTTFTDCEFQGNYISMNEKYGGAVYIYATTPITFTNCSFDGNSAANGYGGTLAINNTGSINIYGGEIKNSHAKNAGAILVKGEGSLVIAKNGNTGTLFYRNYADKWGGAIRFESKHTNFSCTGATFTENHIDYVGTDACYGGAVAIASEQNEACVNIADCVFEGNYSACNGGSALSYQSSSNADYGGFTGYLRVVNTRFEGNHTDFSGNSNKPNETGRHGGAVRLGHDGTDSYFDGCTFIGNYTETPNANRIGAYGGAVTFYSDGMGYFNNCYFEGNRACRGGAISAKGCPVSGIYLNACSFSGNWNSYGGGTTIVLDKVMKFCMNNCSFNDNTYTTSSNIATENTAWVYADGDSNTDSPDIKMSEVVVSNCTAIGTCRSDASTEYTAGGRELFYFRRMVSDSKMYLINNCLINTGTKHDAWWTNAIDLLGYYNVFYTAGRTNGSYSGTACSGKYSGSGTEIAKADLLPANIAWDSTNHVWPWNGSLTNGKTYTNISASTFDSTLATASADFKAWLENVDPKGPTVKNMLHTDQLGNNRGSGSWRPGAYQQ